MRPFSNPSAIKFVKRLASIPELTTGGMVNDAVGSQVGFEEGFRVVGLGVGCEDVGKLVGDGVGFNVGFDVGLPVGLRGATLGVDGEAGGFAPVVDSTEQEPDNSMHSSYSIQALSHCSGEKNTPAV